MDIFSILMIVVFVVGYAAIALEHPIKVDKAASALLTGVLCWTFYVFGGYQDAHHVELSLLHHVAEIASILFFLMGAMTIVELVDAHEGFSVITDRISTTNKTSLLWVVSFITFFLSAALDNLTTAIVMISLLRKLIKDQETRWLFGGFVIIAANAGGAWSPIGDVTTTMLWIKGQLPDTGAMIIHLIVPSLFTIILPLLFVSLFMKGGKIERPIRVEEEGHYTNPVTSKEKNLVFVLGIGGLLFVPIFKTVTHLPPFMGMMLSLGILWVVTELMHASKNREERKSLSVIGVLQKIDTASVLFFLGILLAVGALQVVGHLATTANFLDTALNKNIYSINIAIGLLSAIVDNVPLVAAAQGMYEILPSGDFAAGGSFWEFLAYCAGTGGSCLIIGSAAGVAVMGLEHISFGWYLKKISPLAFLGYLGGAGAYILMHVL
ncbi:MAG: sodium:proton antiporter NhaD [Flavobacteriales bacterium]|nr:sodium:proton antiporter NhaD [Flavobacteriales bacterium]